ncbi:MAG TPA: cytochrome c oxidase subunit 3 [Terriglobales bacterium]|nr:cytochrome c oxidase subunit 3 [Terriglobales bacterium]
MPVISPPVAIEKATPRHGGGGVLPPEYGGGGDNGPGDGSFDYERRLHRARLALLLAIGSIGVLFVTLTVLFVLMRHGAAVLDVRTGNYIRQWIPLELPMRLLLLNTLILLASSITIELAKRSLGREMVLAPVRSIPGISVGRVRSAPWLGITIILGLLFVAGQGAAWWGVWDRGFTGIPSPFFYLLTGAHAVHLIGGLIVLSYAGVIALLHRSIEHQGIVLEVATWYWHFMGALWIYIFLLLYMAA